MSNATVSPLHGGQYVLGLQSLKIPGGFTLPLWHIDFSLSSEKKCLTMLHPVVDHSRD